jgi:predicted dehydrogenase
MIGFGIIGCGAIADRHAKHIVDHAEARLIAVYDITDEKSKQLSAKYNTEAAIALQNILDNANIEIVSVCTPNGLHFQSAIDVLNSGKHVIVEKPMALKREHCEEMIEASLRNNRQLFVVKQNRFNPPIQALKKLIDENKLGKIYAVMVNCFWNRNERYYKNSDWKGNKELDGGTLFTQFSHFVDIFYYLFGDISNVNGIIKNCNHQGMIEFEDSGCFTFTFTKSGALGSLNYTTSSFEQNMEGSITVFAENATIKVGGQYLNALDYQKTKGFDIVDLPVSNTENDYGFYKGSMSNHDKMISNVINTLQGRSTMMTNAVEGMKVVHIIENMYKQAQWIQS